jgi:hypothetical protein
MRRLYRGRGGGGGGEGGGGSWCPLVPPQGGFYGKVKKSKKIEKNRKKMVPKMVLGGRG